MSNNVTKVMVYTYERPSKSTIIKLEPLLENAAGSFVEALDGGQMLLTITLESGQELHPLVAGSSVHVQGMHDGNSFIPPGPLIVMSTHRPWKLSGRFGSTG